MQYSKPMIDLVYEIRRRVSSDLKPAVKLANPDMLSELAACYADSRDTVTRALIKELLQLAGPPWNRMLEEEKVDLPRQVTNIYRGQFSLVESGGQKTGSNAQAEQKAESPGKRQRIYRGQLVN